MNGETGRRIPIAGLFLFLDIMTVVIAEFISQLLFTCADNARLLHGRSKLRLLRFINRYV